MKTLGRIGGPSEIIIQVNQKEKKIYWKEIKSLFALRLKVGAGGIFKQNQAKVVYLIEAKYIFWLFFLVRNVRN